MRLFWDQGRSQYSKRKDERFQRMLLCSLVLKYSNLIYKREPRTDLTAPLTVHTTAWIDLEIAMMIRATSRMVYGYLACLGEPPRNRDLHKTEQLRLPQQGADTVQNARRLLLVLRRHRLRLAWFQYARIVVLRDSGCEHSTRCP